MERKQFTFYASFYQAVSRIKNKAARCDAYDAICAYALTGDPPDLDKLPDAAAIAFDLIKPNLDASKRKAEAGKSGGRAKQTASKLEAGDKLGETAREKEIEKEIEIEVENECYPPTPLPPADDVAGVLADYLNRVNPSASQTSLDELRGYAEEMGAAVCRRAVDIALDSKKATWPYIRGILRDKHQRGVRCLADWDALERQRLDGTASPEKGTDVSWMKEYM